MNSKKQFLCVLLSLVMVLSPYIPRITLAQEQHSASVSDDYAFDVETVRGFIDTNLALENVDEEFYYVIAQAYQTSPRLFAQMIEDLSVEQIEYLAKGIAYAAAKFEMNMPAVQENTFQTDASLAIAKIIQMQAVRTQVADLNVLYETPLVTIDNIPADAESMSTTGITVSNISFTSGQLVVGDTETVQFTLSRYGSPGSSRTVSVEVYQLRNGVKLLKSSKSVTIPTGSSSATFTSNISLNSTGNIQIIVEVYGTQGGAMVGSGTSTSTYPVYGRWRIRVALPEDRNYKGTLYLYNCQGSLQTSGECLGKSETGLPSDEEFGHTPTGTYTGVLHWHKDYTEDSYGKERVVAMTGVSGQIIESERSEIMIHGGKPNTNSSDPAYPLRVTKGCIRVTTEFQLTIKLTIEGLIENLHLATGNVVVEEQEWLDEEW